MKLYHKIPCNDCPWKKNSLQGYLGGWSADFYADAVQMNEIPACHNHDHGPESEDTAFCVGALCTANNSCTSSWKTPGADEAKDKVKGHEECFQWPREFYEYHAQEPYVHPIERALKRAGKQ